MLEILKFIFSEWYIFVGVIVLIVVIGEAIGEAISNIVSSFKNKNTD